MKNGKRLTVSQRNHIESFKLNSDDWFICKCMSDEWELVHKVTGKTRTIPAPQKEVNV